MNRWMELHAFCSDAKNALTQCSGHLKQSFVISFGVSYLRRLVISTSFLISLAYFNFYCPVLQCAWFCKLYLIVENFSS